MSHWFDERWARRISITVNHAMVSGGEDLLNFPLYLPMQKQELLVARPDGHDFLFTSADGVTKLAHEIRYWNPADGRLIAYVKIPRLSPATDTVIFLYFGNPLAEDQQDIDAVWREYTYSRHLGAESGERRHTGPKGGTISGADFFRLQVQVLEDLFGADWFTRPTRRRDAHPAYGDWSYCNSVVRSDGKFFWRDQQELHELARKWASVVRRNASLVQCTKGDIGNFRLGHLANYGDERVRRRLEAVIVDNNQYLDVLSEFRCVGWHSSQGHDVVVSENSGWADFRILIPTWESAVVADCKRLSKAPTKRTVKRHVEKANRQVKAVGDDAYGLLFLDASES